MWWWGFLTPARTLQSQTSYAVSRAVGIAIDVRGGKPVGENAFRRKPGVTRLVTNPAGVVFLTVDFDRQSGLGAVEIENIGAGGMLAAEGQVVACAEFQSFPKQVFRAQSGFCGIGGRGRLCG